jgi:hypothetical protein
MWIDVDTSPTESGYYATAYIRDGVVYYKSFWYDAKTSEWVFRFKPDVKVWWDKRFDYYIPCEIQGDVDPVPENLCQKYFSDLTENGN